MAKDTLSLEENTSNFTIGVLSTVDEDTTQTYAYSIMDNDNFVVDGDLLKVRIHYSINMLP